MSAIALGVWLFFGLLALRVGGTVFTSPTQAGLQSSYDFIVIGGMLIYIRY